MSGLKREEYQINTKIAYFPPNCKGKIWPWYDGNMKGEELASLDTCLKELEMDYVDCLLIHHPVTSAGEFKAGITPHYFAFGHNADNSFQEVPTIEPL